MAKKTLKLVDPTDPASAITPPRPLGEHGMRLWHRHAASEYDIADIGGREMLAQACAALDRAEELREQIDRDGGRHQIRNAACAITRRSSTSWQAARLLFAPWHGSGLMLSRLAALGDRAHLGA